MPVDLSTPITYLKGVGPQRGKVLEGKGILTVEDLLYYMPFRYEDRSNLKPIDELAPGEMARALEPGIRDAMVRDLKAIGYRYITLDLQGYRMGSLNEGVRLKPV